MDFITSKEASLKWNISERRIRQLLKEGRIEGAIKLGNTWSIPSNVNRPRDKRMIGSNLDKFIINLDDNYFDELDSLNRRLSSHKPIDETTLYSMRESLNLEWIYNSNGIEGNTLTLMETKVVLEGIAVGGKSIQEHLEVLNHEAAIEYLDEILKDDEEVTEWHIKNIHGLILKGIDDKNAGVYRKANVIIKGAHHNPPDYLKVNELMDQLIYNYNHWQNYHPIIKAALLHGELVKIHPFIDGNGRTSRLIMNMELMKLGYSPVIIKQEDKLKYYEALDKAHTTNDYTDFVKIIAELEIEILNKYLEIL